MVKTYPNQKFLKRDRNTSFHQEVDVAVDANGNGYVKSDDEDDQNEDAGTTPTSDKI